MGDFEKILARVPASERAALQAWWNSTPEAHRAYALSDLEKRYPRIPIPSQVPGASDATQSTVPGIPMMTPSVMGPETNGPRIPLPAPTRGPLGSAQAFARGALNSLPYADEAAGGIASLLPGAAPYETNRQMAEYLMGQSALEHPTASMAGTGAGMVGQMALLPAASAEQLAARGIPRMLAQGTAEGAGLGALYGSGASDPGLSNRLSGGLTGAIFGGPLGFLGSVGGMAAGTRAGSAAGREASDIAHIGNTPLTAARSLLDQAGPDVPLVGADVLGPEALARVHQGSMVPGEAQDIYRQSLIQRQSTRPDRVQSIIEHATGTQNINPYQHIEDLQKARSAEADRLYNIAYQDKPSQAAFRVRQVPRVRGIVDALREADVQNGLPRRTGPATVQELHAVRMQLDADSRALQMPGATSEARREAFGIKTLRDQLDAALKDRPAFAAADNAFNDASKIQDAFQFGTEASRKPSQLIEKTLGEYTPAQMEAFRMGFPSSIGRDIEGGNARGVLSRIGLGSTPKVGRQRALDAALSPEAQHQIVRTVGGEEFLAPAERAASVMINGVNPGSPAANPLAGHIGGLGFGLDYILRHITASALRAPASPEAQAATARVLTTGGIDRSALESLLASAQSARVAKGAVRGGFQLGARAAAAAVPTVMRMDTQATRAAKADRWEQLVQSGISHEAATQQVEQEFR